MSEASVALTPGLCHPDITRYSSSPQSSPTKPLTQTDTHTLADITRYSSPTEPLQCTAELCSYPHVKLSIRDLNPIFTTAPIFQQSHYFRQNLLGSVSLSIYIYGHIAIIIPSYNLRTMQAMGSLGTS